MSDLNRLARSSRRRFLVQAGAGLAAGGWVVAGADALWAEEFRSYWVRTRLAAELWSGPDRGAISFGASPEGSFLEVVAPPAGSRLYVRNPVSANYAYVDASAVEPTDPPELDAAGRPVGTWVANHRTTMLWSGPDRRALPLGQLEQWNLFEVVGDRGERFRVREPHTGGYAYLEASAVGRVGVPGEPLSAPTRWWGATGSAANVRSAPNTEGAARGELRVRTPIVVARWVAGQEVFPDQPTWAQLADDVFLYSPLLRAAAIERPPAPPPGAPSNGRWIDASLTLQLATAWEGRDAVYLARFSSGRPGWETSTGVFRIQRRVANEVMDSSTLLGRDAARASYRVEGIRWTQYFTADGQAIHHNYWRDPALFGIPSSHGCLGMLEPDARWFWDWADVGTPLVVHY